MSGIRGAMPRAILPFTVFAGVAAFHFAWLGLFPEKSQAEESCEGECACEAPTWLDRYVVGQHYWLGYSYAGSLTFAATALRRYRERRLCTARSFALGGITFSGALAVLGCYLLGCCGSPMLPIYLSLFGTAFLPLAKPLVAGLTTLSLLAAWWWLRRQDRRVARADLAPPAQRATPCCASEAARYRTLEYTGDRP